MKRSIYILSSPRILGEYKVGVHTGNLKKLRNRYKTYIPDVRVHYLIENVDGSTVEKEFKRQHSIDRIEFDQGSIRSEWFKLPLNLIVKDLLLIIFKDTFPNRTVIIKSVE